MANRASELIEIELGAKGLEYVREICGDVSGLCSRLGRVVGKTLTVTGLVPGGTPRARGEQLETGGLVSLYTACEWLANQTNELSSKHGPAILLAQDIWMTDADPYDFVDAPGIRRFSYLGCPYRFLASQPLQVDDIQDLVNSLVSFYPVLAVSHCHLEIRGEQNTPTIYQDTFDVIWKGTSQILVGAYDRESFLVLRPKNKNYFGELL